MNMLHEISNRNIQQNWIKQKVCPNCLKITVLKTDAEITLPAQRCIHCGLDMS